MNPKAFEQHWCTGNKQKPSTLALVSRHQVQWALCDDVIVKIAAQPSHSVHRSGCTANQNGFKLNLDTMAQYARGHLCRIPSRVSSKQLTFSFSSVLTFSCALTIAFPSRVTSWVCLPRSLVSCMDKWGIDLIKVYRNICDLDQIKREGVF